MKSVCSKHASLSTFFDKFFRVLSCLRNERNHSTLMALAKKQVSIYSPGFPEEKFMDVLTLYANGFVQKQLSLRSNVTMVSDNGTSCTILSSNGHLNVTTYDCQCVFWKSMHLPCRHIFLVREHLNVSLSMALTALPQDGQKNSCVADFVTRKTLPYLRRLLK